MVESLGLLVAQQFFGEEADEALVRLLRGRLSLEYLTWNGRTDNDDIFANVVDKRTTSLAPSRGGVKFLNF
jgi:endonuclease YncB( thermonuclease family)